MFACFFLLVGIHGHKHAYALAYILAAAWPAAWVVYCVPCLRRTWTPPYRTLAHLLPVVVLRCMRGFDIFPSGNMHELRTCASTDQGRGQRRTTHDQLASLGGQCSVPAGQCMLAHSFARAGFSCHFLLLFFFLSWPHTSPPYTLLAMHACLFKLSWVLHFICFLFFFFSPAKTRSRPERKGTHTWIYNIITKLKLTTH